MDGGGKVGRRRAAACPVWRGEPVVGLGVILDVRHDEQLVVQLDKFAWLEWLARVADMANVHYI
jgi:hypothetical protein